LSLRLPFAAMLMADEALFSIISIDRGLQVPCSTFANSTPYSCLSLLPSAGSPTTFPLGNFGLPCWQPKFFGFSRDRVHRRFPLFPTLRDLGTLDILLSKSSSLFCLFSVFSLLISSFNTYAETRLPFDKRDCVVA